MAPSPERSALMSRIGPKNTKPELVVRQFLHRMGYRYRLHVSDLPGKPDLVFPLRRKVIFVHGCFWHRHEGCRAASMPKTRRTFWELKFAANVERDARKIADLRQAGWEATVVWECETKRELSPLIARLAKFLGPSNRAQPASPPPSC